jgi:hypothetical protein
VELSAENVDGYNPMEVAEGEGHTACATLIYAAAYSVHAAAKAGNVEKLQALIRTGVFRRQLTSRTQLDSKTPFQLAETHTACVD